MKVKWTDYRPLHTIPEEYWGEDLSLMDSHYEGEVIGNGDSFWNGPYLMVMCTDGKVRKCPYESAKEVKALDIKV